MGAQFRSRGHKAELGIDRNIVECHPDLQQQQKAKFHQQLEFPVTIYGVDHFLPFI